MVGQVSIFWGDSSMNADTSSAGADDLGESEARFRASLSRLADALGEVNGLRNSAQKLTAENETLKEGLERLTGDYGALEKSFLELKDQKQKTGGQAEDVVQREMQTLRADYAAMEQSYGLLKTQFLDAKETSDDARRKMKAMKVQKIAANGSLNKDDALIEMKAGIVAQLDGTIGKLEQILGANDA